MGSSFSAKQYIIRSIIVESAICGSTTELECGLLHCTACTIPVSWVLVPFTILSWKVFWASFSVLLSAAGMLTSVKWATATYGRCDFWRKGGKGPWMYCQGREYTQNTREHYICTSLPQNSSEIILDSWFMAVHEHSRLGRVHRALLLWPKTLADQRWAGRNCKDMQEFW